MRKPIRGAIDIEKPTASPTEVQFECGALDEAAVTVCITLYNYENFIVDALHSVFDQTLESLALVVLDDRSTDSGPRMVERWMGTHGDRFAGTRLLRHRMNKGLGYARNSAIANAESEFVMILDADNELYPRCTERLAAGLQETDSAFAYCILERFGDHVGLMGTMNWDPELLRGENYIDAMAMLRKSTWEDVGGYTPMSVSGWEDYDFWCRCAEAGVAGLFVPEILARYRVHNASMLHLETNESNKNSELRAHMVERHPWLEI